MSRRFRKPLEKKSVREDKRGPAKRGTDKRASGKGKPASGKPSFGPRTSEKRGPASAGKFASRPPARELHPEPVREEKPAPPPLPTKVQTVVVTADENNMRVDRFLEHRFPGLSFSHIQRIVRKGELVIPGEGSYREGEVRWVRGGTAYGPEMGGPDGVEFWFVSMGPFGTIDPDITPPPAREG